MQTSIFSLAGLKSGLINRNLWREMSFDEYLELFSKQPSVACSAYQRMHQALLRWGKEKYVFARQEIIHYKFADDPFENGRDAIYGLDKQLMRLMVVLRAAAARRGQERRIMLLHGPVGSAKSTLARLLRKALEHHSRTEEGQLYTLSWIAKDDQYREILGLGDSKADRTDCPLNEEPLRLLPEDARNTMLAMINKNRLAEERIEVEGDLCPRCRFFYKQLLHKFNEEDAWKKILENNIRVRRVVFAASDRIGIGSFRPKDEKNQDSTELTGDINFRKLPEYGLESDPRAFNFDGEFQISNRGFFFVEEILKLDKAFLYDFLGATQEHIVKPKRFAEMHIDCVLMGGTNNPEYEKIRNDETMQALRDRTTRLDVPYVLKLAEEQKIYAKTYRPENESGARHIAPHTIEMASLWAILTRLQDSKTGIDLRDKVRIYDGKMVEGFSEDKVIELLKDSPQEAMSGISPRYIQDMLGNAAMGDGDEQCVNWFNIKKHLADGLQYHSLLKSNKAEDLNRFTTLLEAVDEEFGDKVKAEVQQAVVGDEKDVENLFKNYIDNVVAFVNKEKVKDHKGEYVEADKKLMAEVEKEIGVGGANAEEYRHKLIQAYGTRVYKGRLFDYRSDERLRTALERLLFKRRKDTIRLVGLTTGGVSPEEREKIETLKKNLKHQYGYCDFCASLVLNHVASIFARGDEPLT